MSPFISVVIPTYNHAHFLKRALQSVLDQNYSNLEILVIDNHSEDNTDEIVLEFNDERIKLFKIHNNGIIAASRNLGIKESKGAWIAFLDSDDLWYSTKFNTIMDSLILEDFDVISTDEIMVNIETGKKHHLRYGPYTNDFYKTMLLYGNRLSTSATVLNSNFVNFNKVFFRENKDFNTVEDYDLWLRLALAGARFKFFNKIEGEYTIHADNTSHNKQLHENNLYRLLSDHVFNLQTISSNNDYLLKMAFSRVHLYKLLKSLRSGSLTQFYYEAIAINYIWLIKFIFVCLRRVCVIRFP
jgi:glycosyltransferase involved in cell wall biosynthesis